MRLIDLNCPVKPEREIKDFRNEKIPFIYKGFSGAKVRCETSAEKACKSVPMLAQYARMIDRTKKLPARFYVNPAGRKPVREWILELPDADRHRVGKDIQKVEFGWPLGRPHCAPLGKACGRCAARSTATGLRG